MNVNMNMNVNVKNKMKAFVRTSVTSQEVVLQEVQIPQILSDEVLIKVKSFGVGIHDRYFIPGNANFPYTIGSEGAGIIEKLGANVHNFKLGDKVIFSTILQKQGGSWAEYAVAKQSVLMPLPKNLTFSQGATISIAGTTALECIKSINLNKGNKLFIAGASGAIGTLVIQMAHRKGIHISASASEKNHDYLKSLGVEKAVDYTDEKWIGKVKEWSLNGVDTALAIQPGTGTDSIKVVKNNGLLITVSGDSHTVVPERNITVRQMEHSNDTHKRVKDLVNDISNNQIKITIEREFEFENALKALEKTETRHARGKVVVNGID